MDNERNLRASTAGSGSSRTSWTTACRLLRPATVAGAACGAAWRHGRAGQLHALPGDCLQGQAPLSSPTQASSHRLTLCSVCINDLLLLQTPTLLHAHADHCTLSRCCCHSDTAPRRQAGGRAGSDVARQLLPVEEAGHGHLTLSCRLPGRLRTLVPAVQTPHLQEHVKALSVTLNCPDASTAMLLVWPACLSACPTSQGGESRLPRHPHSAQGSPRTALCGAMPRPGP